MNTKPLLKYKIGNQILMSWIVLFMIIVAFATIIYLSEHNIYFYIGILSIAPICFVVMISVNLYRYRIFMQIYQCECVTNKNTEIGEIDLQIKKSSYKTKPIKQSYDITINPLFENTKSLYIRSEKRFYLMILVPDFVIFQQYIQPFLFTLEPSECVNIIKVQRINKYEKKMVDKDILLTSSQFLPALNAIKLSSSIIKDYI
jgi:hypothetical protein